MNPAKRPTIIKHRMKNTLRSSGVTVIELMVVAVILCILAALIVLTASGVQAKNRNSDRQVAIDNIRTQLESYYAGTDRYPTLENINNKEWRSDNLPKLQDEWIKDPRWNDNVEECTQNGQPILTAEPAPNCYSYQVTSSDGQACDNADNPCVHYTLTASLEGGEKYDKSSLN